MPQVQLVQGTPTSNRRMMDFISKKLSSPELAAPPLFNQDHRISVYSHLHILCDLSTVTLCKTVQRGPNLRSFPFRSAQLTGI